MQRNCTQIKKWEIAEFIFIAIVGTLLHFVYDWSGQNPAVGIIAPVSESTWGTFKAALYAGTFIYTDPGGSDWQRLSVPIDAKSKSRLSGYGVDRRRILYLYRRLGERCGMDRYSLVLHRSGILYMAF